MMTGLHACDLRKKREKQNKMISTQPGLTYRERSQGAAVGVLGDNAAKLPMCGHRPVVTSDDDAIERPPRAEDAG
jgi:hypothetical protein